MKALIIGLALATFGAVSVLHAEEGAAPAPGADTNAATAPANGATGTTEAGKTTETKSETTKTTKKHHAKKHGKKHGKKAAAEGEGATQQ